MTTVDLPLAAPEQAGCSTLDAFGILSHCHEHILEALQRLERLAAQLQAGEPLCDARLARLCEVFVFLDTAIPVHTRDEEETLYPRLAALSRFGGKAGTPLELLERDHSGHRRLLAQLKQAVMRKEAPLAGRVAQQVVAEYREHIAREDDVLFPLARQALSDPACVAAMTAEMRGHRHEVGLGKSC